MHGYGRLQFDEEDEKDKKPSTFKYYENDKDTRKTYYMEYGENNRIEDEYLSIKLDKDEIMLYRCGVGVSKTKLCLKWILILLLCVFTIVLNILFPSREIFNTIVSIYFLGFCFLISLIYISVILKVKSTNVYYITNKRLIAKMAFNKQVTSIKISDIFGIHKTWNYVDSLMGVRYAKSIIFTNNQSIKFGFYHLTLEDADFVMKKVKEIQDDNYKTI